MIVKLLTERPLEFLSLKRGCRGLSESTLVKISNCWKSHATAHIVSSGHHNESMNLGSPTSPVNPLGHQSQFLPSYLLGESMSHSVSKIWHFICFVSSS